MNADNLKKQWIESLAKKVAKDLKDFLQSQYQFDDEGKQLPSVMVAVFCQAAVDAILS